MAETVVKERGVVDGKYTATEKKLNDDSAEAMEFNKFVIVSPDKSKKMYLKLDNTGVAYLEDESGDVYRILTGGLNVKSGTLSMHGTKFVYVPFDKPMRRKPNVTISEVDNNATPVHSVSSNRFGFKVKFKNTVNAEFEWQAIGD